MELLYGSVSVQPRDRGEIGIGRYINNDSVYYLGILVLLIIAR